MLGEGGTPLEKLHQAVVAFQGRDSRVDLKGLRSEIDALEREFAAEAHSAQRSGEHLVLGNVSAVSWIARTCGMSATSAADRLCVGEQLESLPRVAAALSSGEISYQSASLLCHLRDQLADKRGLFDETEMLELARQHSVATLRYLCRYARHVADPDGFAAEAEENYHRRRLHVSQMADGMHWVDGILDPIGVRRSRPRSTRWRGGWGRMTSGRRRSAGRIPWSSWWSTPWSQAGCRGATGSSPTSR